MTIPEFLKNNRLVLLLILLLGGLLRFYRADFQSLWFDELIVMNTSDPVNSFADIILTLRRNIHPPLYYLSINLWFKIWGYTDLAARLLSAIFGVLGIWAIYALGKTLKGEKLGLFAAFVLAINYYHIYYSQEVRSYALLFLLSTFSFHLFFRLVQSHGLRYFAGLTLANIALIYTHYYGLFIVLTQGTALVWLFLRKNGNLRLYSLLALSFLLTALSYYAWISTLLKAASSKSIWIGRPSILYIPEYLYQYTGKDPVLTLLFTVLAVVYFVHLFTLVRKWKSATEPEKKELDMHVILFLWVFVCIGLPFIRSQFSTPMLLARYTLIIIPVLILWAGMGWMQLKTKATHFILPIILLSTLVNFAFFNQYYSKITKEQWREVARDVTAENKTKDYRIFSFWQKYYRFYLQDAGSVRKAEDPANLDFNSELSDDKGFWVLSGHGGIDIFWQPVELSFEQKDYIRRNFILRKEIKYFDAAAQLYERP
jgi:uncharacterized membrane protein